MTFTYFVLLLKLFYIYNRYSYQNILCIYDLDDFLEQYTSDLSENTIIKMKNYSVLLEEIDELNGEFVNTIRGYLKESIKDLLSQEETIQIEYLGFLLPKVQSDTEKELLADRFVNSFFAFNEDYLEQYLNVCFSYLKYFSYT